MHTCLIHMKCAMITCSEVCECYSRALKYVSVCVCVCACVIPSTGVAITEVEVDVLEAVVNEAP